MTRHEPNLRSCYRKDGHAKVTYTKSEAKQKAREMRRASGKLIKAYDCPWCHGWHIGKPARRNPNG